MSCSKLIKNSHLLYNSSFINRALLTKGNLKSTLLNYKILHHPFVSSNCNYSTVIASEKILLHRLYPAVSGFTSKAFISTEIPNEQFKVIVTNPSISSSTSISNSADSPANEILQSASSASPQALQNATSATSETLHDIASVSTDISAPLLDTATSLSGELTSTLAKIAEPSITTLGLGNYTPPGALQLLLEYFHISWDMPWWGTIVLSTVLIRILLLPLLIKTQKNAINTSNYMPQLQYIQGKFNEARKTGNAMEAQRYAHELMMYMKEHKISPLKSSLLPLLQAPIFISFFFALRGMANAPVESMKWGGLGWTTDLTIPDPYYMLPVIASTTLYIILKVGAESGIKLDNMKMAKYFLQALPVVAFPFMINFPSAVLYYWCTTNLCTLVIVSILKIQPVRIFFNMPTVQPLSDKFKLPNKGFVKGVKEAYEDQKILQLIDDRRRVDLIRFQKAGTGPIPRTYSYDPTKPRPSNAAAAVSAKEHKS